MAGARKLRESVQRRPLNYWTALFFAIRKAYCDSTLWRFLLMPQFSPASRIAPFMRWWLNLERGNDLPWKCFWPALIKRQDTATKRREVIRRFTTTFQSHRRRKRRVLRWLRCVLI